MRVPDVRRFVVGLAVAAVLVFVAPTTTATAVPVSTLCTANDARGVVPAVFPLDACVDGSSVTVRNDLQVPVLVRREGEVGDSVRLHERGSPTATVLRILTDAPTREILMPGDVVRWPVGLGAAALHVADVDPVTTAILAAVEADLPAEGARGAAHNFPRVRGGHPRDPGRCRGAHHVRAGQELPAGGELRRARHHRDQPHRHRSPAARDGGGGAARRPRPPALDAMDDPRPTHLSAVSPTGMVLTQAAVPPPVVVPPPEPPAAAPAPAPAPASVPAPAPKPAPARHRSRPPHLLRR